MQKVRCQPHTGPIKLSGDNMNPVDSVRYVNEHFEYASDSNRYGVAEVWTFMTKPPFRGDCEDYALTVLYNICDKNVWKVLWLLLTFQAAIVGCAAPSKEGHAVLRHRGFYVDNWQRRWVTRSYLVEKGYKFNNFMFLIHFLPFMQIFKLLIGTVIRKLKNRRGK